MAECKHQNESERVAATGNQVDISPHHDVEHKGRSERQHAVQPIYVRFKVRQNHSVQRQGTSLQGAVTGRGHDGGGASGGGEGGC